MEEAVVLVTGCSKGGIGFDYCKEFAKRGCRVFASDVGGVEGMSELREMQVQTPIRTFEMDVTCEESVRQGVQRVVAEAGRLDVLVNNAGVGSTGPLAEIPLAEVQRAWEINCVGPLRMVQAVVPHMAGRGSGTILNVGSVVGTVATPWAGAYCATKAALHSMTEALRLEVMPLGIRVVLVVPGAVQSGFGRRNAERLRGRPWELYAPFAEAIALRASASQGPASTPAPLFARNIVKRVLGGRPPRRIAYGRMTALFALLAWSPPCLRDLFLRKRFGL